MATTKKDKRIRRKKAIAKKQNRFSGKLRVFAFRSTKYLYLGVADDISHKVLFSKRSKKGLEESKKNGVEIGKKLKKIKVEEVVFDRSGYKYHGNIKSAVEGLRESGIKV
ncbi:50S ribosomal protein L18 [Candidatus Dojkabacteria bacterium]|uniref:50S ribosomal protein L18 n=1 Tax=Candidatus Dojkabacteria bacterium TaxID=2099670 RepID=A0A955HZL2_9BACT|nr:50S ribosomal protein L18 [Candidatus Dojkabacteria bacterium]MCB9790794.1 50S ribosomal protein L18 [Candidatus Nomurabacteria bacterium]